MHKLRFIIPFIFIIYGAAFADGGLVLRASGGYDVPLLDNKRLWSPGGPKATVSAEWIFKSGTGIGLDLGYVFWRKSEDIVYAKSRSYLHRVPVTTHFLLPLTGSGLFEGFDNQLYWLLAGGAEVRLLHWSLDWEYDVFRENTWKVYPAISTGFRFEFRGDGGGYFIEPDVSYVFSRSGHGFHDLSFSIAGGLMWF